MPEFALENPDDVKYIDRLKQLMNEQVKMLCCCKQ